MIEQKRVESLSWVLPRPNPSKYPGAVPMWFEKKLFSLYPDCKRILQPFGGDGEYGLICDIKPEVNPDIVSDAHNLPFSDKTFDFVFCDPPYTNELSKSIYNTGPLSQKDWVFEAVRVCKVGGFIALYHERMLPRPPQTAFHRRILLATRVNLGLRICQVFQRYSCIHYDPPKNCPECFWLYKSNQNHQEVLNLN